MNNTLVNISIGVYYISEFIFYFISGTDYKDKVMFNYTFTIIIYHVSYIVVFLFTGYSIYVSYNHIEELKLDNIGNEINTMINNISNIENNITNRDNFSNKCKIYVEKYKIIGNILTVSTFNTIFHLIIFTSLTTHIHTKVNNVYNSNNVQLNGTYAIVSGHNIDFVDEKTLKLYHINIRIFILTTMHLIYRVVLYFTIRGIENRVFNSLLI